MTDGSADQRFIENKNEGGYCGIVDARVTTVIPTFADFDPSGHFFGLRAACPDGSMPIVGFYGRTPAMTDCLMIRVEYGNGCSKICPMFGIHGIDLYNGW